MKEKILSISELTRTIKSTLELEIGSVSVSGEVSNFKQHSSGHRYFTLKDENSQINCTMWRSRNLTFAPTDGMMVQARGKITVYPPRGSYQIEITSMQPMGQGDLFLAYEALKAKLSENGYFEAERKRQLPTLPMAIGVSTSPTGAAVKDIISTTARRFPAAEIYFRPTLVQGDGSAEDIVDAIHELNESPAELIIIGRGGGSLEDLWAYNMENVADAIYNSEKPIISAVGHETDFTIADFVADMRAATPTAAAEIATPFEKDFLMENINNWKNIIRRRVGETIRDEKENLDDLFGDSSLRRIMDKINTSRQFADESQMRIMQAIKRKIDNELKTLKSSASHLGSLYPLAPLDRGFALLRSEGKIISNDDTLGNYINIDIQRANELAQVSVNQVKNIKK
jgi:exodeoxyribonuclease VII large subunit